MVAAAELLRTDFLLHVGGGGVNYAERWREASQPLWWTASFKQGPLPAVLQLQGSPVGLGIWPNWGLAEMTDSARNQSQLIFHYPNCVCVCVCVCVRERERERAIKMRKTIQKVAKLLFLLLSVCLKYNPQNWHLSQKISPQIKPLPSGKCRKSSWTSPLPSSGSGVSPCW
jgi:hypothetical protein